MCAMYLCAHDVLLWWRIARVQQELIRHIVDAYSEVSSSTQVYELGLVICLADDDILGLDVPVHNASGMASFQRLKHLSQCNSDVRFGSMLCTGDASGL